MTDGSGKINRECISEVCRQIAHLMRLGHHVAIVTSGAIASDEHKKRSSNLRAAVGQGKIFSTYATYLATYNIEAAQLLLTDEQLIEGRTKVTKPLIQEAFSEGVVCIINANDVIDSTESDALKYCADNDKLTELVCLMISADLAIIAFNEDGIWDDKKQIIHEVKPSDIKKIKTFASGGNKLGHGDDGMLTKITTLGNLAASGIKSVLAPGRKENFILRAVAGEEKFGTKFLTE